MFARAGTLTVERSEVASVIPVDGVAELELLRLAASLEQGDGHPIAAAIVATAEGRSLRLGRSHGLRAVPGKGVVGVVQLRNVAVGDAALMAETGIDSGSLEPEARRLRALGRSVVFVVLSGDHAESVRIVAAELGIEDVAAGMLPGAAATYIGELRAAGHGVAMVGAGAHDAPAPAAADVGISLVDGTDIVQQAAGTLYPLAGLLLSPVFAAIAMSLGSACIIGNAPRLRSVRA